MPSDDKLTSPTLLKRAGSKEPDAWQRLVHLYSPLVHYWCQRSGVLPEDAQDVVQEVFVAVAGGLDAFQSQGAGSFRAWVRGITRHKVLDHRRRQQRQVAAAAGGTEAQLRMQDVTEEETPSVSSAEDAAERSTLCRRAMELVRDGFEETTWRAFLRTAIDGLPAPVAAQELGLSPVAVRIAKTRVLARLREEMQGLLD